MGVFPHIEPHIDPHSDDQGQQNYKKKKKGMILMFWTNLIQKWTYLGTSIQEAAAEFLEVLEGYVLKWHFVARVGAQV